MKDGGLQNDSSLPRPYRVVSAIVLRQDTPSHALTSAAGWHQATQQDSIETSMGDVARMFVRHLDQQRIARRNPNLSTLTDDDVLSVLQMVGLVRGDRSVAAERAGIDITTWSCS